MFQRLFYLSVIASCLSITTACTPTVEVAVPQEPITINLNVKIEHEIKIQVEKELDALFSEEEDLF